MPFSVSKSPPYPVCVCLQMWLKFIKRRHSALFFWARGAALCGRRMWMVASWRENNKPWNLILVAGRATWGGERQRRDADPECAFCWCFSAYYSKDSAFQKLGDYWRLTALPFFYFMMHLFSVISLRPRSRIAWTTGKSDKGLSFPIWSTMSLLSSTDGYWLRHWQFALCVLAKPAGANVGSCGYVQVFILLV